MRAIAKKTIHFSIGQNKVVFKYFCKRTKSSTQFFGDILQIRSVQKWLLIEVLKIYLEHPHSFIKAHAQVLFCYILNIHRFLTHFWLLIVTTKYFCSWSQTALVFPLKQYNEDSCVDRTKTKYAILLLK